MPQIILKTNIDKYKGKFPEIYQIPRIGEKVKVNDIYEKDLPFPTLTVVDVTYISHDEVEVELHLSELQHQQAIQYKLNVYN